MECLGAQQWLVYSSRLGRPAVSFPSAVLVYTSTINVFKDKGDDTESFETGFCPPDLHTGGHVRGQKNMFWRQRILPSAGIFHPDTHQHPDTFPFGKMEVFFSVMELLLHFPKLWLEWNDFLFQLLSPHLLWQRLWTVVWVWVASQTHASGCSAPCWCNYLGRSGRCGLLKGSSELQLEIML